MLARIQLGSEIDIATSDELKKMGDSITDRLTNRDGPKPLYNSTSGSILTTAFDAGGANNNGSIRLGKPSTGRIWNILGIVCFGNDDHTTVANTSAALYFGDPSNPSLAQCKDVGLNFPSSKFYSDKVLWATAKDEIFLSVNSLGVGVQVAANVFYTDWPADARLSMRA